jgi:hypothetical protein
VHSLQTVIIHDSRIDARTHNRKDFSANVCDLLCGLEDFMLMNGRQKMLRS